MLFSEYLVLCKILFEHKDTFILHNEAAFYSDFADEPIIANVKL